MLKANAFVGLVAALGLLSGAAVAEQGDSSSYGTVGWGPVVSTQSLSRFDRSWNHASQSKYQAYDGAEWLRQYGEGLFPFFWRRHP